MQTHGVGRRLDVACRVLAAQAEAWGRINTPESCVAVCAWNLSPGEAKTGGFLDRQMARPARTSESHIHWDSRSQKQGGNTQARHQR